METRRARISAASAAIRWYTGTGVDQTRSTSTDSRAKVRMVFLPDGSKNPAQVVGFQAIETEIVKSQGLIALIGRDLMANGVLIVNGPEGTMTLALP